MLFWSIAVLVALIAAGIAVRPLLRPAPATDEARNDIAIYRDQLAEVDRDLARGVLDEAEAERTRTEIARRLLAADKAQQATVTDAPAGGTRNLAIITAAFLVLGGGGLYYYLGAPGYPDLPRALRIANATEARANRPTQAEAEALADALPATAVDAPQEYKDMVQQLRDVVPTRPDDAQGWTLLARHEANLGNYVAAREAQEKLVALRGDDVTVDELVLLADIMVAATGGTVTPETDTVLKQILALDPRNLAAQYYVGLLFAQTGRPDEAFTRWRVVAEQGDMEDAHTQLARAQVEQAAQFAGAEYTLPDLPGPSAADVANAQDMTEGDRAAMIESMVAQLSDRLATEGGSPEEWARLLNAYGVLGRPEDAAPIWAEAQSVFGNDPEALAVVRQGAVAAGVAE